MKYLQRLQDDIDHTNTVIYLFKDKSYEFSCVNDYEMIVKYKDISRFKRYRKHLDTLLYYCVYYGNIQFIVDVLLKKKSLIEEIICYCAECGRIHLLKFFIKYIKSGCKYALNHAANGHPNCMLLLDKLGYGTEDIDREKCLCPISGDMEDDMIEAIAFNGHPKCLRILIKRGIILNENLYWIAARGHPKCFELAFKHVFEHSHVDMLSLYRDTRGYPECRKILDKLDTYW